jgi:hypothetical protein
MILPVASFLAAQCPRRVMSNVQTHFRRATHLIVTIVFSSVCQRHKLFSLRSSVLFKKPQMPQPPSSMRRTILIELPVHDRLSSFHCFSSLPSLHLRLPHHLRLLGWRVIKQLIITRNTNVLVIIDEVVHLAIVFVVFTLLIVLIRSRRG